MPWFVIVLILLSAIFNSVSQTLTDKATKIHGPKVQYIIGVPIVILGGLVFLIINWLKSDWHKITATSLKMGISAAIIGGTNFTILLFIWKLTPDNVRPIVIATYMVTSLASLTAIDYFLGNRLGVERFIWLGIALISIAAIHLRT